MYITNFVFLKTNSHYKSLFAVFFFFVAINPFCDFYLFFTHSLELPNTSYQKIQLPVSSQVFGRWH